MGQGAAMRGEIASHGPFGLADHAPVAGRKPPRQGQVGGLKRKHGVVVWYCIVLYWIGLYCIGLDCIGLHWIRIVLYCIVLASQAGESQPSGV